MRLRLKDCIRLSTSFVISFILVLALVCISFGKGSFNIWSRMRDYLLMVICGDLGSASYGSKVIFEVLTRLPRTLILVIATLVVSGVMGAVLGMLFSRNGSKTKTTLQIFVSTIPVSLPDVLIILLLQMLMINLRYAGLPFLPTTGYNGIANIILPTISLSIIPAFYIARITSVIAIEAYGEKFVLTSRAKGSSRLRVHWVHVWRKIRPQVIKSFYGVIPLIISNLLIVEKLFYYPGLSFNLLKALQKSDLNLFMGLTIGLVFVYLVAVLVVYAVQNIDARSRGDNKYASN